VRVLYRKHGSVPLVSLILVVPRGAETDPVGKEGLTSLMADLLDEGAGKLDALAISEKLQGLATELQIMANTDGVVLSMNLIAENFGPSVDLLADIVRRPRLDEKEFQRRKAQVIAQAIASEADPQYARRNMLYRGLFGKGYGGGLPQGTRASLEAITFADVKTHYKRLMAAEGSAFIVTGGIDQETATRELKRAFGDWSGQPSTEARPLTPSATTGKLYLADYPGAAQSVIGLVRRAPGADADDLFASTVFNRSFGEAFTSRVNLNLREDKGYAYGAISIFQRFRQVGFFGVFSNVRTDATRASLDEMLRELSNVCGSRPLAAAERDDSVNGLLLGYPATFESIERLGERFAQIPLHNRPLDWFERWPSRIAAVTLEQVNQAAKSYCQRSDYVMLVAGDAAKVASTLDGIGFDLVKVNARGEPL
jgi:predicted Zn-dependent peptidase